jgi:hypothetical protein
MIVDDKSKTREVKFCDVPNGEVFMEDGVYYLAIEGIHDNWGDCKNAVNLNEGKVTYFECDDMVVWVKATLTIENR